MPAPHGSIGRRAALVLAAALAAATVGAAQPAAATPAAASAVPATATAALDWLQGELAAAGGHLTTSYEYGGSVYSYDDWGLTLDAALALAAGGREGGSAATTALSQVADHIADYVTGASFGAPDDRYAAALGKSTLAAAALGVDPTSFGGFDLVGELRARMQTSGADAGRFSDLSDYGDYSNGLGQALAIMGLARTSDGVPASALGFLLDQQCPGGGFRGDYTSSGGCTDDADATVDATGFAIQALTAVEPTCAVRDDIAKAAAWLVAGQGSNGGFGGESGANTNSSGLAAQALRAIGSTTSADAAAGFITALQLTTGADAGAIALNQAGYDAGGDGIAVLERDGFRRATGQAVLALDLPAYSEINAAPVDPAALVPCVDPAPTGTTPVATGATSSSTVVLGGTTTVTGSGFTPGEQVSVTLLSTPVLLGTTTADAAGRVARTVTIPADLEVGNHHIELVGVTSGLRVSIPIEVLAATVARPGTLPATGSGTGPEAALAVGLLVLGAALVSIGRRRGAEV
jgi:LPXTG-motif cell wall-anchored protein